MSRPPCADPTPVGERLTRAWFLAALGVVEEGIAPPATVDLACRTTAGFAAGPFAVMDERGPRAVHETLVTAWRESFGEPRWRPSPLGARWAAAGRPWSEFPRPRQADGEPAAPCPADGELVVIAGEALVAGELAEAALAAGWEVASPAEAAGEVPAVILDCRLTGEELDDPLQGGPQAILCAAGSLASLDAGGSSVGFHLLSPLSGAPLVELTRTADSAPAAAAAAERFFGTVGPTSWVEDAPGLVLGRLAAALVNEAAFALGEGLGTAEEIDAAFTAAVGAPRGPLAWGDAIGLDHVVALLDGLAEERGAERWRIAPRLRALVLGGRIGDHVGEGFHRHLFGG